MEVNSSGFWDAAYRDNAPALLGVLRRYVKDTGTAQDLLHEVYIAAMDKYDGYAGKGSFEGWLYKITVNTALMHLRNERNNPADTQYVSSLHVADDDADDAPHDDAKAAIEAADFSGEELLSAIDRLPEHHKLVFNMYVMDDFSHKQIATKLNISSGTSKSHLARARKKIQQILYDDAMNREKKKERRRTSAFLLLFPAKGHYIDQLYRDGLSNFTIPPAGGAEFLTAALEQQAASVASSAATSAVSAVSQSAAFLGSKLSYLAACCGTAAITGSVCWVTMSDNSPLNRDKEMMNSEITAGDTLMYSPDAIREDTFVPDSAIFNDGDATRHVFPDFSAQREPNDSMSPSDEKTAAPVVVKKQIIERQTVVVRDTVFIVE